MGMKQSINMKYGMKLSISKEFYCRDHRATPFFEFDNLEEKDVAVGDGADVFT